MSTVNFFDLKQVYNLIIFTILEYYIIKNKIIQFVQL